jgi:hypothetical protein
MHAEDREKLIAMMTAVLLAPNFDALQHAQKGDSELLHDPIVTSALRTARVICDAVEDEEQRHDSVVFENPGEREQPEAAVNRAVRRLDRMGQKEPKQQKRK